MGEPSSELATKLNSIDITKTRLTLSHFAKISELYNPVEGRQDHLLKGRSNEMIMRAWRNGWYQGTVKPYGKDLSKEKFDVQFESVSTHLHTSCQFNHCNKYVNELITVKSNDVHKHHIHSNKDQGIYKHALNTLFLLNKYYVFILS